MRISGTHVQGLHSNQVRRHTQIDLLTCRVCFVKHMMITAQVRHHTLLDLSTCRVCSVKHMMIMPVICCQDGCLMAFAKVALPEDYLSHNLDEQCLGGH